MYGHYYPGEVKRERDESIYNLISRPQEKAERPPMHRSRYPPDAPPSASTFGRSRVSQALVTNLAGEYNIPQGNHGYKKSWDDFGPPREHTSDPTQFLKKKTGFDPLPPRTLFVCLFGFLNFACVFFIFLPSLSLVCPILVREPGPFL